MLSKFESRTHLNIAKSHLRSVHQAVRDGAVEIDGSSLTLGEVVAVSR